MHFVLHVPLRGSCRRIPASDDTTASLLSQFSHGFSEGFGTLGKVVELEDASRAIPHNGFGTENGVTEQFHGLWATIHAFPIFWDSFFLSYHLYLLVILEFL